MPGIVHQNIDALMLGEDHWQGLRPIARLRDIECNAVTLRRKFPLQSIGVFSIGAHAQKHKVLRRFCNERARDGMAEAAVCARDENDARTHSGHRDEGLRARARYDLWPEE